MIYVNPEINLEIYPVDSSRWKDFELLFGEKGACGGCWCMYWRRRGSEYQKNRGSGNKQAMQELVRQNEQVGLLAYQDDKPVGWCALAPREVYPRLENSKVWKRIDDQPVWSINCFFISKPFRKKGIALELVKAAILFCKANKIKILESYPIVPYDRKIPDAFAWTGFPAIFKKAGFVVAERRSPAKPIMRYYL